MNAERAFAIGVALVMFLITPACTGSSKKGSAGTDAIAGAGDVRAGDVQAGDATSDASADATADGGGDAIGPRDVTGDIKAGLVLRGHLVPSGGVSMSPSFELTGALSLGPWPGVISSTSYRLRLTAPVARSKQ